MGTEVLPPQHLLAGRLREPPASFHRRRNFPGNENLTHLIVNRKHSYHTAHKKKSPRPDKKRSTSSPENKKVEGRRKDDSGGLVMGQVTILRRGESLDSLASKIKGGKPNPRSPNQKKPADDMAVLGTVRIGPESPNLRPKQIRLSPPPSFHNVYAGSAFTMSPSPRALPLPSFFNKKEQIDCGEVRPSDDPATRDLRRLLRLD
ncbi:hypothetical protein STAS_27435 [Striga asiatica]|uniref:Uncharacterized protein n=1 Tax=Striga asiatica TaxID=4170 RepID=A0A5A7QXK6_STRAF|nr:hypothetical protein STAS_27435 [Striga asiatica]